MLSLCSVYAKKKTFWFQFLSVQKRNLTAIYYIDNGDSSIPTNCSICSKCPAQSKGGLLEPRLYIIRYGP